MRSCVVDTSVTLAWYLTEEHSASAREWQERMLSGVTRLLVPSLHYWEFANALRSLTVRGEILEPAARTVFDLHLGAPLEASEPDRRKVLEVALEYGATVYDAVFIALALARDVPLLTAERTTTRWVTKLGERVVPVR